MQPYKENVMDCDPELNSFLAELASMLSAGKVTPRDIYETMMEVNDNDHHLAMAIKKKAMSMAMTIASSSCANEVYIRN